MEWLWRIWQLVAGDPAATEPYDMDRVREMIDFLRDIDPVEPTASQRAA